MEYLQGRGVAFTVLPAPSSDDPVKTAAFHGFVPDDVVSVGVITNRFGDAIMVIPAVSTLDLDLACEALGEPDSRLVTQAEMEHRYPGYSMGCLPPLGLFFMAPIYVDPQVMMHHSIVFALGRPGLAIRMKTRDLFRDEAVVLAPLTSASREPSYVAPHASVLQQEPADDLTIVLDGPTDP